MGSGEWGFRLGSHVDLSRFGLVVQAALFDRVSFDPFAFEQDGLASSEVDVRRSEITEALVVSVMIIVLDEGGDLGFEVLAEELIFEQDAALQCLVPALDFPCVCGWPGAPWTWSILYFSSHSTRSEAT